MEKEQIYAKVSGSVQGVFYRDAIVEKAWQLGLVGQVKNLANGQVEVIAQGPKEDLKKFIVSLWQGSPASEVTNVDVDWQPSSNEFDRFSKLY